MTVFKHYFNLHFIFISSKYTHQGPAQSIFQNFASEFCLRNDQLIWRDISIRFQKWCTQRNGMIQRVRLLTKKTNNIWMLLKNALKTNWENTCSIQQSPLKHILMHATIINYDRSLWCPNVDEILFPKKSILSL